MDLDVQSNWGLTIPPPKATYRYGFSRVRGTFFEWSAEFVATGLRVTSVQSATVIETRLSNDREHSS